ncbi:hypothetical protein OKW21_000435 [Catalinimonas alkaloidigena]|uniref:hypothetical protein n=1 Tax=Catalinimonas alkaloidigena TaxID=1075417 RepID=UPI002405344A|nr:hypothetical protein [Catalinimonas alkaloidigena]MDF9795172.1 hypothetical protein [Catalinimonas alkaloidigena]
MSKFYTFIISLCICFLSLEESWAQCPQLDQISIHTSNAQSFEKDEGTLLFTISADIAFNKDQYRIRLWDHDKQRYIYDDNNPDFLNITEVKVDQNQISFASLPKGKYALELHGGNCQYTRFEVSGHSETKSN